MNNLNGKEKNNLVQRIMERLKVIFQRFRLIKTLPSLFLVISLAFAPFTISCSNNVNDLGTNPPSQEQEESEYSQLLLNVINDSQYNSLIQKCMSGVISAKDELFDPHPYGFLESQGYDVSKIKNGNLSCYTNSFILDEEPNSLYIATFVETKASTPYYTEYLVKYTLTDKEKADYHMLHDEEFIHSVFINDEISKTKTPTIVSKTRCTVEAHNGLQKSLENLYSAKQMLNGMPVASILLKSFDVTNGTFEVYLFAGTNDFLSRNKVAVIPLENGTNIVASDSNNAFYKPFKWGEYGLSDNFNKYAGKNARNYHTQNDNMFTVRFVFDK